MLNIEKLVGVGFSGEDKSAGRWVPGREKRFGWERVKKKWAGACWCCVRRAGEREKRRCERPSRRGLAGTGINGNHQGRPREDQGKTKVKEVRSTAGRSGAAEGKRREGRILVGKCTNQDIKWE